MRGERGSEGKEIERKGIHTEMEEIDESEKVDEDEDEDKDEDEDANRDEGGGGIALPIVRKTTRS